MHTQGGEVLSIFADKHLMPIAEELRQLLARLGPERLAPPGTGKGGVLLGRHEGRR